MESKKNIETNETTNKVNNGDGLCKSKVSGLIINDAPKKENPKSGGNSGSLNNAAVIANTKFGAAFQGSALTVKEVLKDDSEEVLKDETEVIVKSPSNLDNTGNVGLDFIEDVDASLENSGSLNNASVIANPKFGAAFQGSALTVKEALKDETEVIVKSPSNLDKTGNVGLDFIEDVDASLENSGSLNNAAIIANTEYDAVFRGSALTVKEVLKDETEVIVKSPSKLDKTGNVGLDFIEGVDASLENSGSLNNAAVFANTEYGAAFQGSALTVKEALKDETEVIVKSPSNLDKTGNVGLDFVEDVDASLENSGSLNNASVIANPKFYAVFRGSALTVKEVLKDETEVIVKLPSKLDKTGNVGSDFVEDVDASLENSGSLNNAAIIANTEYGAAFQGSAITVKEALKEVCNPKGSGLTPNDATEKENPKSVGKNSGSLINEIIDDPEFTNPFCGSALALKEVLKDETKEIVKSAVGLDKTGNVGLDFNEGADAKLKDSKTETTEIANTGDCTNFVMESSNTSKWKMCFGLGLKLLIRVLLLCTLVGFINASDTGNQSPGGQGVRLDSSLDELKGLRGNKNSEKSDIGVIENVKKFMFSLSKNMGVVQNHYKEGNVEEAGKALKDMVGDDDTVAKFTKDIQQIQDTTDKDLPEFFTKGGELTSNAGTISLKDIPNAMLGGQIHQEVFDKIVELSKDLAETLEEIDLSLLEDASSKQKIRLDSSSRRQSRAPPKNNHQTASDFLENAHFDATSFFQMNSDFKSGNTGGISNFMKTSSLKSIQKQMKVQRKGISLPKLSTLVSVRDFETVMSKHKLRQEAMEVCLPECDISDTACNCRRLFDCVNKLDEYDMAALTAGGFIDSTVGSENYGEFGVGADK
eukprot:scaffold16650_cov38-Cyclotella_meneghiniana.AAC.6